jgi:hypothetical protein
LKQQRSWSRIKTSSSLSFLASLKNDNDENNDIDKNNNKSNEQSDKRKQDNDDHADADADAANNENLITYEELMRDPIYGPKEYYKSRNRRNNLFLMQDIGKAFNVLLYAFVISSVCLRSVGYGYMVIPSEMNATGGGFRLGNSVIRIDTLENKAFFLEMNGNDEQAAKIRKSLKNYKNDNI